MAALTPREREIVQLLAQGKTPKEIAYTLCIERHTVYLHLGSARKKTNTASSLELAVKSSATE